MTEDEAKTKWCPFAREPLTAYDGSIPIGSSVVNRTRNGTAPFASLCLASECMAWRDNKHNRSTTWEGKGVIPPLGATILSDGSWKIDIASVGGHCGLAGAPQ
jgi:hypothetical protein